MIENECDWELSTIIEEMLKIHIVIGPFIWETTSNNHAQVKNITNFNCSQILFAWFCYKCKNYMNECAWPAVLTLIGADLQFICQCWRWTGSQVNAVTQVKLDTAS